MLSVGCLHLVKWGWLSQYATLMYCTGWSFFQACKRLYSGIYNIITMQLKLGHAWLHSYLYSSSIVYLLPPNFEPITFLAITGKH